MQKSKPETEGKSPTSKEISISLPIELHTLCLARFKELYFYNMGEYIRFCIRSELDITSSNKPKDPFQL